MTIERLLSLLDGADAQASVPPSVHFGFLVAALVLCLIISVIDARRRIIPDTLNALLAGTGIVLAGFGGPGSVAVAALVGTLSFGFFAAFRSVYRALRGLHGLGFGDVKFLGAAAVWVGLGGIAPLVLVASMTALVYVAAARLRGVVVTGRSTLPFGPFLALGLAAVLGVSQVWPPEP